MEPPPDNKLMRHFCTYFDQHYLPRVLALYLSLRRHNDDFTLWALYMDEPSCQAMRQLALPHVQLISLPELEQGDPDLAAVRSTRSLIEYYFTCTPCLAHYIFSHFPQVSALTYLDADLYFFSSYQAVFDETGDRSIAIIPHRFSPLLKGAEINGIYNVGWVYFRRDADGLGCLNWWRERCLEWCYDRIEEKRFADQKYLDEWPTRFHRVAVIQQQGANLAPWNLAGMRLTEKASLFYANKDPLIFYHFHALRQSSDGNWSPRLGPYYVVYYSPVIQQIYRSYLADLVAIEREVRVRFPVLQSPLRHGSGSAQNAGSIPIPKLNLAFRLRRKLVRLAANWQETRQVFSPASLSLPLDRQKEVIELFQQMQPTNSTQDHSIA